MGLGGVILAAGESTRMHQDKALLPWPPPSGRTGTDSSTTLLSAAIETFTQFCDLVIVVAGKNEATLMPVVYGCGAFLVRNPAPERGQFSSLQVGLSEVLNRGRDAAIITLVDRPPAHPATLTNLKEAFDRRSHSTWAVVPEYQGKHGHPIITGREMIEAFLKASPTANAREIEHANQDRIEYIRVDDSRVTVNINTPEDYAWLESSFGSPPNQTTN
jgi:molybdenum cofactor cytidylyltransferase